MPRINGHRVTEQATASGAFTFIEVIVALAIVSISLLGLLKLHLVSIGMADAAAMTAQAVFLAQEKIAETMALGYPQVGVDTGAAEYDTADFRWRTEVSDLQLPELAQAEVAGLRRISVDVTWKQGIRRKHLQMSTCVADRKLQ
jgi:prepilin-type N-terminal cleavage/methylation domain-containing protein